MIVVADPHYKREIYHDHGSSRYAYMSSTGPNRPWWSCAAFTRLAACGCPWHAPDVGEGSSGTAPYAAADIRGGPLDPPRRAS